MSTYNARRAPNVSQYIANLNNIPTAHDLQQDFSQLDDGFDLLTNTEFFDLDAAAFAPPPQQPFEQRGHDGAKPGDELNYPFGDFQNFGTSTGPSSSLASPSALQGQYPNQSYAAAPHDGLVTGGKRKASASAQLPTAADLEEASRVAAEEDKRRRNTAASARFRIKKKQREQALEKQTKEMADKVQLLEGKVSQLEMENKWLKGLITDKSEVKNLEVLLEQRKGEHRESVERSRGSRTDGVGTEEDAKEEEELEIDPDL